MNFSACRFERNSQGVGKRGTLQRECEYFELNKAHRLSAGSYLLSYSDSITTVEIRAGEAKVMNLAKIQAPRVKGKPYIRLYVDYKSEREQNKHLLNMRLKMSHYEYSTLQAESWGRNFLKPYIDSGNYSTLPSDARNTLFADGEKCEVTSRGVVEKCNLQIVGDFSPITERGTCHYATRRDGSQEHRCSMKEVANDYSRAFFLVFPGTYTMRWSDYDRSYTQDDLVKTGIVIN